MNRGLVVVLALLFGGCGQDRAANPAANPAPSRFSFYDELPSAIVEQAGLLKGSEAELRDLLLEEEFDEQFERQPGQRWFHGQGLKDEPASPLDARVVVDPEDGRRYLFLPPGGAGIQCVLPCEDQFNYLVSVRLKSLADSSSNPASIWVTPLSLPATRTAVANRGIEALLPTGRGRRHQKAAVEEGSRGEWAQLQVELAPLVTRKALHLRLVGGSGGALVDSVLVRRVGWRESLNLGASRGPIEELLAQRVTVGRVSQDTLLLPVPCEISYSVRLPGDAPRFDGYTALLARAGERASLRLLVEGSEVAARSIELEADAARSPFSPWTVDLSAHAGNQVKVSLVADGDPGSVVCLGAPELLHSAVTPPGPNLVLLSLDTLRPDHVGCCSGAAESITPNLDRFAGAGVVFRQAHSPNCYTLPSHVTMLTGQHSLEHGVSDHGDRVDRDRTPLLAARLQARGYATAAFTGGGFLDPVFGVDQGFRTYSVSDPGLTIPFTHIHKRAAQVNALPAAESLAALDPALSFLDRFSDQPFFLFVHTFVTHNYYPHAEYLIPIETEVPEDVKALPGQELWARAAQGDRDCLQRLRDLYRASIVQADDLVVRPLLAKIESLGLTGNTVVAIVSDHGEEMFEHGKLGHGDNLYSESVRVVWLLRGPGVPEAEIITELASLVDLAPTVGGLLGLERDQRTSGRRWFSPAPDATKSELVLHHHERWDGLVTDGWKLLRHQPSAEEEAQLHLFRFPDDRADSEDLKVSMEDRATQLLGQLQQRGAELILHAAPGEGARVELDAATRKRLEELGYVLDDR